MGKNYYRRNYRNHNNGGNTVPTESPQPKNEVASYNARMEYRNDAGYYHLMGIFNSYKPDIVLNMIKDPMAYHEQLREMSLVLYGSNGAFTNTVDYMTSMPTLDYVIVAHGESAMKKKRNKNLMESTLRTIKHREFVRDALFKGMVEGEAYYYFETTSRLPNRQKMLTDIDVHAITEINEMGINASIISLPAEYTRIVGMRNSNYVIAFNLDYFNNGIESPEKKVRKFPKEIRDAYDRKGKSQNGENGNWVVLDSNKTIVHKIRSKRDEPHGRPLVLAAINDILYSDYFTDTKRNVLDDMNNRIVYQTFPEGKEKGTSSLTQPQQKNQHEAVKGAVLNKVGRGGTSFFSVAAGTKIETIKVANTDIFDDKNESSLNNKIALSLGFASSALNGIGSGSYSAQQTNLELVSSEIFQWIDQIATELNKCITQNIITDKKNWVECRYLPITHVNKGNMVGHCKDLYLQGKGSLSLWASACGIPSDVFFSLLDQELEEDIENKYPVHQTSYTMSKESAKSGRPVTDNPTDSTVIARANNANDIPTPSDKL